LRNPSEISSIGGKEKAEKETLEGVDLLESY
jgi:hypothetical protein